MRFFLASIMVWFGAMTGYCQWSMRVQPIELNNVAKTENSNIARTMWYMGLGVMYQPHQHLSLSLDYKINPFASIWDGLSTVPVYKNNVQLGVANYNYKVSELAYKSAYSFVGHNRNSIYIATGLAMRINQRQLDFIPSFSDETERLENLSTKATKITMPLTFYVGLLMKNNGLFGDLYLGYTINNFYGTAWKNPELGDYTIGNKLISNGLVFGFAYNICPTKF